MTEGDTRQKRLLLIDGNAYVWRAFHAIPPRFRPDGLQVNALYGFVSQLLKRMVVNGRSSHAAVVFDHDGPSFRQGLYPPYKANRPPRPDALTRQLPLVREAAGAFSVPWLERAGYEADDLIAAYARAASAEGMKVSVVSADKDLMQLVDDAAGVSIYDPWKGQVIREPEVVAKFGVAPALVPDVQALAGDTVDGVPGVTGVGIKTAASLISEYGSLEALLSRADEVRQPKRRARLIEEADRARLSRRLVTLHAGAPMPTPISGLRVRDFSAPRVRAFLADNDLRVPGPWE